MNKDVRMRGFSQRTSVEDAMGWIQNLDLKTATENLSLDFAAGRVLAEDVKSRVNVPGFRRSMMDGFAVQAADVLGADPYNEIELQVVGEVYPGQPCEFDIQSKQSAQVMTGAQLPPSCDAVVPVEYVNYQTGESTVRIQTSIASQKNVGQVGEDIAAEQIVLRKGRCLRPQDVAILAAIGQAIVPVVTRPNVLIIISGNELLPLGESPRGVQIVDSNGVMLKSLIRRDGGQAIFPGILPDDPNIIRNSLETPADIILIAGGSSTGKEDHAPVLIREMGSLDIHGIAMRPSSPAGMGTLGDRPVFLLPGNPVSCLCAYDFFAASVIRRLGGKSPEWPYPKVRLPLARKISSVIGRTDYARVRIEDQQVLPIAISGASILSSAIEADGFCIVPQDSEGFDVGQEVAVYLYDQQPTS